MSELNNEKLWGVWLKNSCDPVTTTRANKRAGLGFIKSELMIAVATQITNCAYAAVKYEYGSDIADCFYEIIDEVTPFLEDAIENYFDMREVNDGSN